LVQEIDLKDGDEIKVNFETGEVINLTKNKKGKAHPFSEVQMEIYKNGGLF